MTLGPKASTQEEARVKQPSSHWRSMTQIEKHRRPQRPCITRWIEWRTQHEVAIRNSKRTNKQGGASMTVSDSMRRTIPWEELSTGKTWWSLTQRHQTQKERERREETHLATELAKNPCPRPSRRTRREGQSPTWGGTKQDANSLKEARSRGKKMTRSKIQLGLRERKGEKDRKDLQVLPEPQMMKEEGTTTINRPGPQPFLLTPAIHCAKTRVRAGIIL